MDSLTAFDLLYDLIVVICCTMAVIGFLGSAVLMYVFYKSAQR